MKIKLMMMMVLLLPMGVMAAEWSGKVIVVADGDTLTVLNGQNKTVKIRMAEIDAPEKSQDFGQKSKQSLSDLCFGKTAKVDDKGTDRYKRTLGRVYCEGVDANATQVKWAYRQYLTDPAIGDLEQEAKAQKIGLWADPKPMPPWEYRHGVKGSTAPAAPATSATSAMDNANGSYYTGPRGGCYALTASGKKRYVAHSFCSH
jgi:endonuclease YncB( thermonuclease family)